MKRSPLKRSSPLRRGKPLAKVSASKRRWRDQYIIQKAKDDPWQVCPCCRTYRHKSEMEPHHPFGQLGNRILVYAWICKGLHRWIHDHGKLARKMGYIMPEFDGRKSTSHTPNYFNLTLP